MLCISRPVATSQSNITWKLTKIETKDRIYIIDLKHIADIGEKIEQ